MREFYRPVDLRSRAAMTDYLAKHFRYHTMNSWNRSTSYACNLKVHNLGLEHDLVMRLFDMIELPEFYEPINDLCRDFAEDHDYRWQVGFNGRSSGYLVLYQGELNPSGYKSYCTACGQHNYRRTVETGKACGKCGRHARVDAKGPIMRACTYPGCSTDMGEDYADWEMFQLRERVKLVQEFDRLADAIVQEAIYMALNYEIGEETYITVHARQVLIPVAC